jgi:hypothetical protein
MEGSRKVSEGRKVSIESNTTHWASATCRRSNGSSTQYQRSPARSIGEGFSNADCAAIPYILRLELLKLTGLWDHYPGIAEWWARMRTRPSIKAVISDRMEEKDWAQFKNLAPDPWPTVQRLLKPAA